MDSHSLKLSDQPGPGLAFKQTSHKNVGCEPWAAGTVAEGIVIALATSPNFQAGLKWCVCGWALFVF